MTDFHASGQLPDPDGTSVHRVRPRLPRGPLAAIGAAVVVAAGLAIMIGSASTAATGAGGDVCADASRTISYDVAAFETVIPVNGWGDNVPGGMMYALQSRKASIVANPNLTQPIVIRANVGDCIKVTLRNDIPGRRVGMSADGVVSSSPETSDGARIGRNPDTSVATGDSVTYTWFAEKEGQGVISDEANHISDKLRASPLTQGLYGAVIVHPQGSTWHNQINGQDLLDNAGNGLETQLFADIHHPDRPDYRSATLIMSELPAVDKTGNKPLMPDTTPAATDATLGFNYRSEPLRNRYQAVLDHRAGKVVTLPNGKVIQPADHFCDGWAPDIGPSGGVAADPGAKCLGEESHLQSWVFGDEGKLTRMVSGQSVTDTDNLIPKAYKGDPITYHVLHPGTEYTHPFHQHTQRWHAEPGNDASPLLDVKALGPGESRSFVIEGGAGGLQGTVGDSIFHCHIYPHFADGFWGHLRIFDRLRDGTQNYPDGTTIQALQELPDRPADNPDNPKPQAADADHPGYPLFVKGDFGQRAYRAPHAVINDPFQAQRRPGDTVRGPTPLEAANMPALDVLKPGAGVVDPCPSDIPAEKRRTYRPHAVDTTITYNKAGWKDRTGRMYVEQSKLVNGRVPAGFTPDPYTIRANVGDCVSIQLTNDLHLDDNPNVPIDHLAKDDGVYNDDHLTSEVSTHVHLVQFDELASDGTSVGWNYSSSAMPGQTYGYRWFVDAPLRTVFFHDHQYANLHQGRGLFAAMNVEPEGATWHDPATGAPTDGTGPVADIHAANQPSFREFTLFHQDQIPMWRPDGTAVNPPPADGVNDFNAGAGGRALNYRNEPFELRAGSDASNVFSSTVHGDPSTPVFKAYPDDPVVIRNVQGSQDSPHTFTLHGHRWRTQPDNPNSNLSDTEAINIAEWFNYEADGGANGVPQSQAGAGSPGDYLYGSTTLDDQVLGMWGIFRVPAAEVADLKPLPDNAAPTANVAWPATAPATEGAPVATQPQARPAAPGADKCPAAAPTRSYAVAAIQRNIVYNAKNGDQDPAGATFVLAADADAVLAGSKPVTPLFLRAAAGECLTVVMSNRLSPTGLPAHTNDAAPIDFAPFTAAAQHRVSMHAGMVRADVTRDDGTNVGYNFQQTVAPGQTITYRWYVDPALEGSSINLMDFGSRVEYRHHGMYAGLLVEPAGSTWVHPTTGAPNPTGDRAVIRWTDGNGTTHSAREFAMQWQDRLSLRAAGADVGKRGLGARGINFRNERLTPRLLSNDEPAFAMSSDVHGDPATPVFPAYAGDPVWMRVLMSGDSVETHQFLLRGHSWPSQWLAAAPGTPTTTYSAQGGLMTGRGFTFVLSGGAGGLRHQAGDFLFRDGMTANETEEGLWGLLRVHATTQAALPDMSGPAAPTNLGATAGGGRAIKLAWSDASADENAFRIERGESADGPFQQLADTKANATTFTDSTGTPDVTYHYRVRARNPLADSPWSNVASATVEPDNNGSSDPPAAPAAPPVADPSAGSLTPPVAARPAVPATCTAAQARLKAATKALALARTRARVARTPAARRTAQQLVARRGKQVKSLRAAAVRACR